MHDGHLPEGVVEFDVDFGIGDFTGAESYMVVEVRMKEYPSDLVGQGSVRVDRDIGSRKVIIVDHTSLLDELRSRVTGFRAFLRASRWLITMVWSLMVLARSSIFNACLTRSCHRSWMITSVSSKNR